MVVDPGLIAGCAAGGLAAGAVLDAVGLRIRPATPDPDPDPISVAGHDAAAVTDPARGPSPDPVAGAGEPRGGAGRVVAPLVTAAVLGLAALVVGPVASLGADCVVLAGLVALSAADLRVGLVPRKILYPVLGAGALGFVGAAAAGGQWRALGDAAIGGVGAFVVFFALWWVYPRGIGFGDVRLAGLVGGGLGWAGLLPLYVGFLVAFLGGALVGVVLMAARGTGRATKLPFAPALSAGALVGMLWGADLVHAWLPSLH